MSKVNLSATFITAASKSMFNASGWQPVGEAYSLKDIWEAQDIDYSAIDGDVAKVTATNFADGNVGLRISVPFKDGTKVELKLSGKSTLEEGDKVKISSITGQELHKAGSEPIVRFDGEEA